MADNIAKKRPRARTKTARSDASITGLPAISTQRQPRLTVEIGPMQETQWTGIPVFTRRLVQALLHHGGVDLTFSFNLTAIPSGNVLAAMKAGTGIFLSQDYEDRAFEAYRPVDISTPVLYPSVKPVCGIMAHEASVVHDISTLVMPENHEEANIAYHLDGLAKELATNQVVFCTSAATRLALETYFPSVRAKTKVLYQYVDWPESFPLQDRNLPRIKLGRYAAVIGTIEPRKNLAILLRALNLPAVQKADLKFVIIGKMGWLVDQFLERLTPAQREKLIFSGYVSDFVKYRLIAAAEFLVFPSLYEGFGIPALEALSLGKPVLAARTSSFPEVIGPAGVYFDPLSVEEFAAGLEEIQRPARLAELSSLARSQCATFTPARMAEPIIDWLASL